MTSDGNEQPTPTTQLADPERIWRFRIVVAVAPLAAVLVLFMIKVAVPYDEIIRGNVREATLFYLFLRPERFAVLIGTLSLVSFASLLMLYLQTGFRRHATSEAGALVDRGIVAQEISKEVAAEIRKLEDEISKIRHSDAQAEEHLNLADRTALVDELKRRIETDAASDILHKIQSQARDGVIQQQIAATLARLAREVDSLSRRGNLNLVIGSTTTIGGIAALFYFLLFKQPVVDPKISPLGYLAEFAPRLSVVILIEVFAYFFLSLYRNSLAEIKYFQNEMTNLECRSLASVAALQQGDAATFASVILKFSDTERNYLRKDETTVDLERAKSQQASVSEVLTQVAAILKASGGKKD